MPPKPLPGKPAPMYPILTNGKSKGEPDLQEAKVSKVSSDGDDGYEDSDEEMWYPKMSESLAKRTFYLAKQERLKSQTLEKTLVLATDAEKVLFDVGREIREGLSALPGRIADAILLIPTKDKNRRFKILSLLEREINECLISLSSGVDGD